MSGEEYRELKELIEGRFGGLGGRFEAIEDRFEKIDQRFEKVDEQFKKVDQRFIELETGLRTTAAETRAHFDAVAEKFRDDVRTVAGGYDHHTTVLDNHEARLQRLEQARLRFDG